MRAYTVAEIDALRTAVWRKHFASWTNDVAVQSANNRQLEDILRTHMLAGHTADDLLAGDSRAAP